MTQNYAKLDELVGFWNVLRSQKNKKIGGKGGGVGFLENAPHL